jgi:hypothetical protein
MARHRSILLGLQVRAARKACTCKHDRSHTIKRGEPRLVVKNPGPASGEDGYCAPCGLAMLKAARDAVEEHLDDLR